MESTEIGIALLPENAQRRRDSTPAGRQDNVGEQRQNIRPGGTRESPDILVFADDVAAQALRSLYFEASQKHCDLNSLKLMGLLEFSFGDPRSFEIVQSKSDILSLAASLTAQNHTRPVLYRQTKVKLEANKHTA